MLAFKSTEIPIEDLRLYFSGTQVRVHEGDKPPRWLEFQDAKSGGLFFTDGKEQVVMKRSPEVLLEQTFPVGFFNTKDSVLYGYRIPFRQVTKGIGKNNYHLATMESLVKETGLFSVDNATLKNLLQTLGSKRVYYNSELFNMIFEKSKYFTISESYVAIKGRKAFARALSPNFAMVPHPHNKDFLIFRHEHPVAELVSKTKIKILTEAFRRECSEFFTNQGATVL